MRPFLNVLKMYSHVIDQVKELEEEALSQIKLRYDEVGDALSEIKKTNG